MDERERRLVMQTALTHQFLNSMCKAHGCAKLNRNHTAAEARACQKTIQDNMRVPQSSPETQAIRAACADQITKMGGQELLDGFFSQEED